MHAPQCLGGLISSVTLRGVILDLLEFTREPDKGLLCHVTGQPAFDRLSPRDGVRHEAFGDEQALAAKQIQLRDEAATLAETLATGETLSPEDVQTALGIFEFAQNAAQIWRGSKMDQ